MANQQLTVDLSFTANTSQVKQELDGLRKSLSQLSTIPKPKYTFMREVVGDTQEVQQEVAKLSSVLSTSLTKSGALDLRKFSQSVGNSKAYLEQLGSTFVKAGSQGTTAFKQLNSLILQSKVPLSQANEAVNNLAKSFMNVAKYQITTKVFNSLLGFVSQAFSYSKQLNQSLTDIRIVSGQSADEMARFAQEANASAQALNTTTKAYADAALIFYQAGFDKDEVIERTDAIIKMSNVTGDSVDQVSSYMMGIWNNFDDGSKSLEYYADVITALGAATASSSEEIANGLERFASIGETVGLSYEYATASLATIVSQTRQSEEIVGTSLKTIFSRLQGLQLGDTLEDGTDLTKYTQALETVGVHVKDANGELRVMDDILDDLGERWQTLDKDQQVALATTVAGKQKEFKLAA